MKRELVKNHVASGLWIFQLLSACIATLVGFCTLRFTVSPLWSLLIAVTVQAVLIGFRPSVQTFLEQRSVGQSPVLKRGIAFTSGILVGSTVLLVANHYKADLRLAAVAALLIANIAVTFTFAVLDGIARSDVAPNKVGAQ